MALINDHSFQERNRFAWYNHPIARPVHYHFCAAIMNDNLKLLGGFNEEFAKGHSFDDNETHYYLPLSGYNVLSVTGASFDVKRFYNDLKNSGVKSINVNIYGVRKGDLDFIKSQKNWVNIESHVTKTLAKLSQAELDNMALNSIDKGRVLQYNNKIADSIEHANSPFLKVMNTCKDVKEVSFSKESFERLCQRYATVISIDSLIKKFVDENAAIYERYPLLSSLDSYRLNSQAVAEYVNLIDTKKGV